ncbi:MAG: hypothetical protein ACFB4I_06565 [Cyanophyceae cyanobacterium]
MSKFVVKPLGAVLQQAGLVSAAQLETALQEQAHSRLRLGEILAAHGWIKLETAEFFVLKWSVALKRPKQRLGKYFKQAALLSEAQIQTILFEQKQTKQKFGEIAVDKGWLAPNTLDFFVQFQASLPKKRLTPERLIHDWLSSSEDRELRNIRARLLYSQQCNPFWVLELYRQILQQGAIDSDGSPEQQELLISGLVIKQQGKLTVAKPIYASVFNQNWVEKQQKQLQPHRQIKLRLEQKVESPYKILEEILLWTNRQPWLAQKLCQMVCQSQHFIVSGEEAQRIEQIVQTAMVRDWQHGVAAEHLFAVRDRLLDSSACPPTHVLLHYLQIWQQGQVSADGSLEQAALLNSGLVVEQQNALKVANPIYRAVFDQSWVMHEMKNLLPGSEPLSIAESSPQQPVTAAPMPNRRWLERAVFVFISAALTGILAAMVFNFQQTQRFLESPSHSTVEPVQPPPKAVFPPIQEASPDTESSFSPAEVSPLPEPEEEATASNVPTFTIGTPEKEVLQALGEPDWIRNGYWANSRAWLYQDIVPGQVDLGYLFDVDTQTLRQTEIAFAPTADLETIQQTLQALLPDRISDSAQSGLVQVYQRRIKQYSFRAGTLEGIIQRNEEDQIYIGIWDADFH